MSWPHVHCNPCLLRPIQKTAASSSQSSTCLSVLMYEKDLLDQQIQKYQTKLKPSDLAALRQKSLLLQKTASNLKIQLQTGGAKALQDYLHKLRTASQAYGVEAKNHALHNSTDKVKTSLTKKTLVDKEVGRQCFVIWWTNCCQKWVSLSDWICLQEVTGQVIELKRNNIDNNHNNQITTKLAMVFTLRNKIETLKCQISWLSEHFLRSSDMFYSKLPNKGLQSYLSSIIIWNYDFGLLEETFAEKGSYSVLRVLEVFIPVPTGPCLLSHSILCFCFIKASRTSALYPRSPSGCDREMTGVENYLIIDGIHRVMKIVQHLRHCLHDIRGY